MAENSTQCSSSTVSERNGIGTVLFQLPWWKTQIAAQAETLTPQQEASVSAQTTSASVLSSEGLQILLWVGGQEDRKNTWKLEAILQMQDSSRIFITFQSSGQHGQQQFVSKHIIPGKLAAGSKYSWSLSETYTLPPTIMLRTRMSKILEEGRWEKYDDTLRKKRELF